MSIIIYYHKLRHKKPSKSTLCDVFRAAALDTWYRIGFSRTRPGLKIHETTITQNLVYELNLLKSVLSGLNFSIFESTNERANGDDLEILIKSSNGSYITFAVQSKILYHNLPLKSKGIKNLTDGKYREMRHYVGKKKKLNQVDLLLSYARTNGHIPIYLLYNYVQTRYETSTKCKISFEEDQYGCSIISAQYLKDRFQISDGNLPRTVKFSELHPDVAQPWFVLACCFPNKNIEEIVKELGGIKLDYEVKFIPEGIVMDDPRWRPIRDASENFYRQFNFGLERLSNDFNPMYRIVLNQSDV